MRNILNEESYGKDWKNYWKEHRNKLCLRDNFSCSPSTSLFSLGNLEAGNAKLLTFALSFPIGTLPISQRNQGMNIGRIVIVSRSLRTAKRQFRCIDAYINRIWSWMEDTPLAKVKYTREYLHLCDATTQSWYCTGPLWTVNWISTALYRSKCSLFSGSELLLLCSVKRSTYPDLT